MNNVPKALLLLAAALACAACGTHAVKSTRYVPAIQGSAAVPEELLLDVGVYVFDPGIDEIKRSEEQTTSHEIRVAESRYAPYMLADTLQRSANWGMVRVMTDDGSGNSAASSGGSTDDGSGVGSPLDVSLRGTILQSNGETMGLRIAVSDSSGRHWYTKEYSEAISEFSYDPTLRQQNDPFQVVYNIIANDLLAWRDARLSEEDIRELRLVSELRFAEDFSPDVFGGHLSQARNGRYRITTLPAADDPMLARIREIRERDFLFIDTVQDYYAGYARNMRVPYDTWREQSYHETLAVRELRGAARRRFIAGAVAVLGGLAAAQNSSTYASHTGAAAAVGAGAYIIKDGFNKQQQVEMHIDALEEIGDSLENEVTPSQLELEHRTITLTGTVAEQYAQWREILSDLYAAEIGAY